jgi:hypothetical protein
LIFGGIVEGDVVFGGEAAAAQVVGAGRDGIGGGEDFVDQDDAAVAVGDGSTPLMNPTSCLKFYSIYNAVALWGYRQFSVWKNVTESGT